jgi:hypothetical protein
VDFSLAKNEPKRRRPIIDTTAQDSDGNYFDQIASETIKYPGGNTLTAPDSLMSRYHTGN